MPDDFSNELTQRLRKAEEAAAYVERLESLASQAPALREQVSLLQRLEEREQHRHDAIERARVALDAASQAQDNLPDIIANAANLVNQLARTLREVDTFRREATASLSVVDRMDYEDELDQALNEQHEDADDGVQRDAQSIRMVIASRHGSARVRQMIDEMSPGFEVFAGCNLDAVPMASGADQHNHGAAGRRSGNEPPAAAAPSGSATTAAANVRAGNRRRAGSGRKRLNAESAIINEAGATIEGRPFLRHRVGIGTGGQESNPHLWFWRPMRLPLHHAGALTR